MSNLKTRMLKIYSTFMKYIISNTLYNLFLTFFENISILFVIDYMFEDDVLSQVFTPFYYLCPHIYLEFLNQLFSNECEQVILPDTSQLDATALKSNTTILFFNNTILTLDGNFCIISSYLVYFAVAIVCLVFILFFLLSIMNPRKEQSGLEKGICYLLTNLNNIILRPLSVNMLIILFNKPIVMLYKNQYINSIYFSFEIGVTILSMAFLIIYITISVIYIKYVENAFYFEKFPYDYYSKSDGLILLTIKIFIAFKINFDKLNGFRYMFFINLMIGIFIFIRILVAIQNRKMIINHIIIKHFRNVLCFFFSLYIFLKLINTNITQLRVYSINTLIIELALISIVLYKIIAKYFHYNDTFVFKKKEEFMEETLHFMYYIGRKFSENTTYNSKKVKRDNFIDNIIIGHKMKCCLEECIICCEDIYNPDLKTFFMVIYQQFLKYEKEFKEKDEGMCIVIRLLLLKMLDDKKVHRISLMTLKNTKVNLSTYLKVFYLYNNMLDDINVDLKNLLMIKYGEVYDDLLKCIGFFEEIFGFVKSRTEKVELVVNKTSEVGFMYNKLLMDLKFLKRNKRIFYDINGMLEIICIVRLLFQKNVDQELTENLEYNFQDFLENVDKKFEENISFIVRYDFSNYIWRIKKIPKKFIDITKFHMTDLIDQSLEKIFPVFLGKQIVKRLEEIILSNIIDQKIVFKTFVSDYETNVKYVKFEVDIIPNLDKNYILYMHCHFHKRQLLIVDEAGNFVNGSEILYKKMGINSEIVTASKGKINMFNVFNLDRKAKLEEVKIVSISNDGLLEATKKVFLLESNIFGTLPVFLDDFIKKDKDMKEKQKRKEKNLVYLNLFETMMINDNKYFVFTIKINSDDKQKEKKIQNKKDTTEETPSSDNHFNAYPKKDSKAYTKNQTFNRKDSNTSSLNSADNMGNTIIQTKKPVTTSKTKINKKVTDNDSKNQDNLNTYQNYLDYYNYFYDTHKSASVTIDYNKGNLGSHHSSMNNSQTSDLFSFLYIRNISPKKRNNKFQKFLYTIYIFNFLLVLLGLIAILYLNSYSKSIFNYIDCYFLFNKLRTRVFSTTSSILSMTKMNSSESDISYDDYINSNYPMLKDIEFDNFLKETLIFYSQNIPQDILTYDRNSYDLFGKDIYNSKINFNSSYVDFRTIGEYTISFENFKDLLSLFFSGTAIKYADSLYLKNFLNISFLDFYTPTGDLNMNMDLITVQDKEYFLSQLNLVGYIYNYFSVFFTNLNAINDYFINFGLTNLNNLQNNTRALLIVIVILHIIFVLISFFSILIFRKIILKEFNTLYSINEEHINKLKEKFRHVKELIKSEHFPSKIYANIRRMREIEVNNFENNRGRHTIASQHSISKKPIIKSLNRTPTILSYKGEDKMSLKNGDLSNEVYLKYSGAKSALMRSNTLQVKDKIDKIKKEQTQQQASLMLLQRLNLEFELIKSFSMFIALMSLFYLAIGISVLFLLSDKYDIVKRNWTYNELMINKNNYLYNYYLSVKVSLILNNPSPYTQKTNITNIDNNSNFLNMFYNVTEDIDSLNTHYTDLKDIFENDTSFNDGMICSQLFELNSELLTYLNNKNFQTTNLISLCNSIPIMKSNSDSIFTNIVMNLRKIYDDFTLKQMPINDRISQLSKEFKMIDILINLFTEPYFTNQLNIRLKDNTHNVAQNFFSFLIAVFSINILIDFLMLLFIWFRIYKKIINYVLNVQLVADSLVIL